MEKRRVILCLTSILLFAGNILLSQEKQTIRPGLIRSQATLSPSYQFANKKSHFFLHGNFEAYLNKHVSVCGDGYYYLNSLSDNSSFSFNHSTFAGLLGHITKNNNDFYIGIQPGISFTKLNESYYGDLLVKTSVGINPLFSSVIGYNYFVNNFFHFFVQSRIVLGSHNYDISTSLNEVRLSAGLGFNLNTMKERN